MKQYRTQEKYIEMKYELVDINQYTEKDLLQKNTLLSYAMLIEKNRGKQSLIEVLEKISKNCKTNQKKEKMQSIINYILQPILKEDTGKMIQKFKKNKEDLDMKTAQDYIREEIRELKRKAIAEGRAEGRAEGQAEKKQIVINMIRGNVEIAKIKEYTGVDEEEIQKIASNM